MSQRLSISITILSCFLFLSLYYLTNLKIFMAAIIVSGILATIIIRPETATIVIIFILYCNFAVIAHRIHGVPQLAASMVSILFLIPFGVHLIRGKNLIIDYTFFLMILYFMFMLVSSLFSEYMDLCLNAVILFCVEGLGVYFTIINVIRNSKLLRQVIWTILLGAILMGGLSIFQEVTKTYSNNYFGLAQTKGAGMDTGQETASGQKVRRHRLAGPIGSKNRYAQIMIVLLPLALYRFFDERKRKLKILAALSGICIIGGTLLTFSRGAGTAGRHTC